MLRQLGRAAIVGLLVPVLVALAAGMAQAQDSSDSWDGTAVSPTCDTTYSFGNPDHKDDIYRSFTPPPGVTSDGKVRVDEYQARVGASPFPAIVIVHGGGWRSGCKANINEEAIRAANAGFITFAIDYRLDCTSQSDPNIGKYCGWPFTTPPNDVRFAVSWVRAHAATYQSFNGKVAALGFSAGGNLVYEAAVTGVVGDSMPDVMAAFSGPTEMGYLADGTTKACDLSFSPTACWGARNQYMACALDMCPTSWISASPYSQVTSNGPPAFIANATAELTPFREADEFRAQLVSLGVTEDLCSIGGPNKHKHATAYEDIVCDGTSTTVWNSTIAFLKAHS